MTIRLLTPYDKYPVNAIVTLDAGTEAGLIAAKMASSDTTGGTAYVAPVAQTYTVPAQLSVDASGNTRLLDPSGQNIGLTRVLAQSAVPIAHTGTTSATILAVVSVPANLMGANGALRITAYWSMTNNANSKNLLIRFGGAATQIWSAGLSSVAASGCQVMVHNRGATGSQIANAGGTGVSFGTLPAPVTMSEDTTQAQNIQFVATLANAADTLTLERYTIEVLR